MNEKQSDALSVLFDIIEHDTENSEIARAILGDLTEMWKIPDDCANHSADSWGCCENCGRMMFV